MPAYDSAFLLNIIENNEMSCAQSGNLETQRKRE